MFPFAAAICSAESSFSFRVHRARARVVLARSKGIPALPAVSTAETDREQIGSSLSTRRRTQPELGPKSGLEGSEVSHQPL